MFTPLIWNVVPRVPDPLKLIDDPDEAVGLFCPEVGFSSNPEKTVARWDKAFQEFVMSAEFKG